MEADWRILQYEVIKFVLEAYSHSCWCHHGRDRMVVGSTSTCAISAYHTKVVSSNPVHAEVYSIQHYVIKFVSNLWQVSGFLHVLQFPLPIKLTTTI